ncbi:hypothetical protein IH970_11110 [candidate division KSB1 bacterium]|nr:hypothetical protein [candidate division KSB1 bacterium]
MRKKINITFLDHRPLPGDIGFFDEFSLAYHRFRVVLVEDKFEKEGECR